MKEIIMILFIGTPELIIVLVVALLIFGPEKIPEIARNLGKGIRMLRDTTLHVKNEIMKEARESGLDNKKLNKDIIREFDDIKEIMDVKEELDDFSEKINEIKGSIKRK